MKRLIERRSRIARVRRIQHGLAANAAAEAASQVQMLEGNRARLAQIRTELKTQTGKTSGAELARAGELAMRLDQARVGLGRSIETARSHAAARESARLAARRDQESAEKLQERARAAAEAVAARKPLRTNRIRPRLDEQGETK
jgi:hypothetical protein